MLRALQLLNEKLKIFNKDNVEYEKLIGDQDATELVPDLPSGGLIEYAAGTYKQKVNVISVANYTGSYEQGILEPKGDKQSDASQLIPVRDNDGGGSGVYLYVGSNVWLSTDTPGLGTWDTDTASATYGVIYFRVQTEGVAQWTTFAANTFDGLQKIELPADVANDKKGGVFYFYYQKVAWEYAFQTGAAGDRITIAQNGSVYKTNIISSANLVIRWDGKTGPAGSATPEITADAPNITSAALTNIAYTTNGYDVNLRRPVGSYDTPATNTVPIVNISNFCQLEITDQQWGYTGTEGINKTYSKDNGGSAWNTIKFSTTANWGSALASEDGLHTITLPATSDTLSDGGSFQFYLDQTAWNYAFAGNQSDIIIAQNGSIYKGSISNSNLVVTWNGQTGPAGAASPDVTADYLRYIENGVTAVVTDTLNSTGFISMQPTTKGLTITIGSYTFTNNTSTGASKIIAGESIGTAEGAFSFNPDGTNEWQEFPTIASDGIQLLNFAHNAEIYFYYKRGAFFSAFNDTTATMIITTDGSVYKNSVSQSNLVVNISGETGFAGGLSYEQKIININTGAIANGEEYLRRLSLYLINQLNLQLSSDEWLDFIGDDIYAIPRTGGEVDAVFIERIVDRIFAIKCTPLGIELALEDFVDDVNVDDDVSSGSFADLSFADYRLERGSGSPVFTTPDGTNIYIIKGCMTGVFGGLPFHFYVELTNPDATQADTITKIVNSYKAAGTVADIVEL